MTLKIPFPNDAKTYGAEWLRYAAETAGIQEGVVGAGDFKVTAAAAGGMRVDIAAGAAYVKGDSGTPGTGVSQGLYLAVNDASIPNAVTLPASNGTDPRVDQIALRVRDNSDLGTGADDLTLLYLSGSATAGATLDNRNGAASLPGDHLRLADVLVPAGSTAVTAGNIRDRRPWARGAHFRFPSNSGDLVLPSGSAVQVFNARAEVQQPVVEIGFSFQAASAANVAWNLHPLLDAAIPAGTPALVGANPPNATEVGYAGRTEFVPAAGSRLFGGSFYANGAGVTIRANASQNLIMHVREIVAQNAAQ